MTTNALAAGVDLEALPGITIQERTVCVSINFRCWGITRQIGEEDYDSEASKKLTTANKLLVSGPEYRAIKRLTWTTRGQVEDRWALSCSMMKLGNYMISVGNVDAVDEYLRGQLRAWDAAVETFIEAYPAMKLRASLPKDKGGLGPLYNPKDYPDADVVRSRFQMQYQWYTTLVPDSLSGLSAGLFERETEKARVQFRDAFGEIRQGLRSGFAALVKRMTDRLTEDDDGKPRVFRDTLVTKMTDFLDTIVARDPTNDAELLALTERAKAIMESVPDARALREDGELREYVRAQFAAIESKVDGMVEVQERAFSFDDV